MSSIEIKEAPPKRKLKKKYSFGFLPHVDSLDAGAIVELRVAPFKIYRLFICDGVRTWIKVSLDSASVPDEAIRKRKVFEKMVAYRMRKSTMFKDLGELCKAGWMAYHVDPVEGEPDLCTIFLKRRKRK